MSRRGTVPVKQSRARNGSRLPSRQGAACRAHNGPDDEATPAKPLFPPQGPQPIWGECSPDPSSLAELCPVGAGALPTARGALADKQLAVTNRDHLPIAHRTDSGPFSLLGVRAKRRDQVSQFGGSFGHSGSMGRAPRGVRRGARRLPGAGNVREPLLVPRRTYPRYGVGSQAVVSDNSPASDPRRRVRPPTSRGRAL